MRPFLTEFLVWCFCVGFPLALYESACGSSSVAPLTVKEGERALHSADTLLHCQALGRAAYEEAGAQDGGREAGLATYDQCVAEAGVGK